jgi:hypothetical protein
MIPLIQLLRRRAWAAWAVILLILARPLTSQEVRMTYVDPPAPVRSQLGIPTDEARTTFGQAWTCSFYYAIGAVITLTLLEGVY